MLQGLRIEGYALIDKLEIEWHAGLTTLTGETGSGKSIVLGALGLVLGDRADTSVIRTGASKCVVEATFYSDVSDWLLAHELDVEHTLELRREISGKGRSRAFINDTPVSVSDLKELGSLLVDLHGQDETLALAERTRRIDLVDSLGDHAEALSAYTESYIAWQNKLTERKALLASTSGPAGDVDYLNYQIEEIQSLGLAQFDVAEREEEWNTLQHASQIRMDLAGAQTCLASDDRDQDVVSALGLAVKSLQRAAQHHAPAADLAERMESLRMEAQELQREIESESDRIQEDPEREQLLSTWLDELQRLLAKHRVGDAEELIALEAQMAEQVETLLHRADRLERIETEINETRAALETAGTALRQAREVQSKRLVEAIQLHLASLKMADAELEIHWTPAPSPDEWGLDDVEWMFRSHGSSAFQPLTSVASGGEKSRLMLAIKAVQAEHTQVKTIILDEIDTGVSGHVAECMANLMEEMAKHQQVIAVTHLPQVAGRAAHHLRVNKASTPTDVTTEVRQLNRVERIQELAAMLSGSTITRAATEHAEQLLR